MQERHRSGNFKQENKPHKHGRHRSKGSISSMSKGKVSLKVLTRKVKAIPNKFERRNHLGQLRMKKRQDVLMKKRQVGGSTTPPLLITLVPLGFEVEPQKLMDLIMNADPEATVTYAAENVFHISLPRWKQRFAFIMPGKDNLYAILDSIKVTDTVIFLMSAQCERFLDGVTEKLLTCLLAQGLPTTSVALLDLDSVALKKRNSVKQEAQKAINRWLPDEKVFSLDKNGDALNLLRKLGDQKQRRIIHRDNRPHLLVEEMKYAAEENASIGTLLLSGYLRGQCLSANGLIHISGWGDFQMLQIDGPPDPHPIEKKNSMDSDIDVLQVANPERQISLVSEMVPDPMDAEQTWPTVEELKEAKQKKKIVRLVPKGTSEYQAAWIPDEGDVSDIDDDDDDDDDKEDFMEMDAASSDESEAWEDASEMMSTTDGVTDDKYDERLDIEEEEEALAKLKAMREEAAFPDEVDTPKDIPARERFAKYRGLASFRTSPWDVKENLPLDYARIFQFENFDRTKKRILREQEEMLDGTQPGGYIRIHVKDVPRELVESHIAGQPLVVFGLLPHEHQMSLLNFLVKRSNNSAFSQCPIKSKDPLVIHCGFRRYRARPIYSQHTNGTKHKYERFFLPESTMAASLYGPITFPPAPVLFFSESGGALIATGRVLSVNPDRLNVKRVILSGHPFRVLKRHAIIRFMFFNREDIEWFKPVELHTKYGRRGHIREPLGTHGHMKAVFDDQLKSQDTVLMTLYKRVFPPWSYDPKVPKAPPLFKFVTFTSEEKME